MDFLTQLWLPILLAAVFVFVVSSVLHMVIPLHRGDFRKLQDEERVLDALRNSGVTPGMYMFPCADSMKDMSSPEMTAKLNRGPCGQLTILPPGGFNMGKSLGQWFGYLLVVSIFVAYLTWEGLGPGVAYLRVFQIAGTAAFMAYAVGACPESIWKGAPWSVTVKFVFDGLVYALVTAGTFGWLWPTGA